MDKYILTDETIDFRDATLYRIKALRDFGSIKAGDKGGFVQSYYNLSQEGDCWIHGESKVFGNAKVYGKAQVFGDAKVYGNAFVHGDAEVYDKAEVFGVAAVYGNAFC